MFAFRALRTRFSAIAPTITALMLLAAEVSLTARALDAQTPTAMSAGSAGPLSDAIAAFQTRRYGQAKAAFREAHEMDPRDGTPMMYLGRLALLEGDDRSAAQWLERAVAAEGDVAAHHHWLGRSYAQGALHAGLFRRARLAGRIKAAFERAVQLDPRDVDARLDLVRFHVTAPGIVGGSVREARAQAGAIRSIDAMWGHIASGIVAEKEGHDAVAERAYRNALAARPAHAAPYLALGAMYQREERWADAFAIYEELRRALPDETSVLYQIGRTSSISGERLDEGARALGRYIALPTVEGTPLPASAHYRLGLIYERQGRVADARREWQRAAQLEPERDEVQEALRRIR